MYNICVNQKNRKGIHMVFEKNTLKELLKEKNITDKRASRAHEGNVQRSH